MRRVTLPIAVALLAALCGPAPRAHAQIYRWEDAQGHLHFSSDPPPAGAKSLGTLDTSKSKVQEEAPPSRAEPSPAAPRESAAAEPAADLEFDEQTFPVGTKGLEVTVAIPPFCKRRNSEGIEPQIVAAFTCGQPGERPEGGLLIAATPEVMTPAEIETACHGQGSLLRVAELSMGRMVSVREAACDSERHRFLLTGTSEQQRNRLLPEVHFAMVPNTEGLVGTGAFWRSGTRPSTIVALRQASDSTRITDRFVVWPQKGGGVMEQLMASLNKDPAARHAPQGSDFATPIAFVFFVLGAVGAIALFRIVRSEDLGRSRRAR
jgi:hypothetical protein